MTLGISGNSIPTDFEFEHLIKMYKIAFINHTLAEIDLAFDLALCGSIEYELNLYDKIFSVAFVSGLMNKYKEWKSTNTDYTKSKNKELPEKSEDEIYAYMKSAVINCFNEYKAGNPEFVKFHIYDWLDKNGFINTAVERKREFFGLAKIQLNEEMKHEKNLAISPSETSRIIDSYSGQTKQVNRAKELNLKDFFDGLIEMEIDIKETIE